MNIKIRNYEINYFADFLHGAKIQGTKLSRMRTRIVRDVGTYLSEKLMPELQIILNKYAELDASGNPIMTDNGAIKWKPTFFEKAMEDMSTLDEEYYYLECSEYMKDAIISIGEFILHNDEIELEGNAATFFDNWCTEFEKAIDYYATK